MQRCTAAAKGGTHSASPASGAFRASNGFDLIDNPLCTAEFLCDEEDESHVARDRAVGVVVVVEIVAESLEVAVKDDPDLLAVSIHDRRAGVAADDVGRREEVEHDAAVLAIAAEIFGILQID